MIYYPDILWTTICNSLVGRIRLSNGLWVTIIPKDNLITCQVQHPMADEVIFNNAEGVDEYLIRMCKVGEGLNYERKTRS